MKGRLLSFVLFVSVINFQPAIIFFNGTSSSGKTTIAKELQKKLGDHSILLQLDELNNALYPSVQQVVDEYEHVIVDTIFVFTSKVKFIYPTF